MPYSTEYWGTPLGYQRITSLVTSTALTVPAGSSVAVVHAETKNVRWRDDGTAPSATVGMIISTSADPFVYRGDLGRIRAIQVSTSAKLNISYYGSPGG